MRQIATNSHANHLRKPFTANDLRNFSRRSEAGGWAGFRGFAAAAMEPIRQRRGTVCLRSRRRLRKSTQLIWWQCITHSRRICEFFHEFRPASQLTSQLASFKLLARKDLGRVAAEAVASPLIVSRLTKVSYGRNTAITDRGPGGHKTHFTVCRCLLVGQPSADCLSRDGATGPAGRMDRWESGIGASVYGTGVWGRTRPWDLAPAGYDQVKFGFEQRPEVS